MGFKVNCKYLIYKIYTIKIDFFSSEFKVSRKRQFCLKVFTFLMSIIKINFEN